MTERRRHYSPTHGARARRRKELRDAAYRKVGAVRAATPLVTPELIAARLRDFYKRRGDGLHIDHERARLMALIGKPVDLLL